MWREQSPDDLARQRSRHYHPAMHPGVLASAALDWNLLEQLIYRGVVEPALPSACRSRPQRPHPQLPALRPAQRQRTDRPHRGPRGDRGYWRGEPWRLPRETDPPTPPQDLTIPVPAARPPSLEL